MAELSFPMEIEGKFRVMDEAELLRRLEQVDAKLLASEEHLDVYLRHPCRDFRVTDEALRVRRLNGRYWMTYKGPRLEGELKMRPEWEVPLKEQTEEEWMRIWEALGFETVARVSKTRQPYQVMAAHGTVVATIDRVDGIGVFAEIERVVTGPEEIEHARDDIEQIARRLGLDRLEKRSYLAMVLEQQR